MPQKAGRIQGKCRTDTVDRKTQKQRRTAPFSRLSDNFETASPADAKVNAMSHDLEHKKIPGKPVPGCVQSHRTGQKSVVPTTTSSTSRLPRFTSVAIHRAKVSAQAAQSAASVMSHWASDQPPIDTLTVADRDRKAQKRHARRGRKTQRRQARQARKDDNKAAGSRITTCADCFSASIGFPTQTTRHGIQSGLASSRYREVFLSNRLAPVVESLSSSTCRKPVDWYPLGGTAFARAVVKTSRCFCRSAIRRVTGAMSCGPRIIRKPRPRR